MRQAPPRENPIVVFRPQPSSTCVPVLPRKGGVGRCREPADERRLGGHEAGRGHQAAAKVGVPVGVDQAAADHADGRPAHFFLGALR